MRRLIADIPRPVLIALAVIVGSLVLFGVLFPLLGGARDAALVQNGTLINEIESTNSALNQSKADQDFVRDNLAKFEELLKSDRLVPHTRRAAIVALGEIATAHGVTLGYSFSLTPSTSATTVTSQPKTDAYRVSVESITLKVAAPLDGAIYAFVADISDSFPGSAIVESVTLGRAATLSAEDLRLISEGSSKLVEGEVKVLWRTAQAQEQQGKK